MNENIYAGLERNIKELYDIWYLILIRLDIFEI